MSRQAHSFFGARFASNRQSVEFRLLAPHASRVEIWVYAQPLNAPSVAQACLTQDSDGTFVTELTLAWLQEHGLSTIFYGYRVWGPNWTFDGEWAPGSTKGFVSDVDGLGNRFNPNKLLLDPYALEVSHVPLTPGVFDGRVYDSGPESRHLDSGGCAPKGIVIDVPSTDFGNKPTRAFRDEILYEVHLRGLTRNDPDVPEALRGTYAGAATRARYLKALGVTAIQFQPVHEFQNALNDIAEMRTWHDYWGYNSVSYLAPCRRYAADQSPAGPTREFQRMVRAFHDAGIKVYIDVVYNHHQEGKVDQATGEIGWIYSLRGLANADYYETKADDQLPNQYQNDNGVGPNLNAASPAFRDLVLQSLQHFAMNLGVDGFRFDLAAVLGNSRARGGYQFDRDDAAGILNRCVRELPARPQEGGAGVDLIAEPYTAGPAAGGQQQGNFPEGWSEWNDRFRDVIRATQNRLFSVSVTPGMLATRIAGSDDLFRARDRRPCNSVNYVTSHDGFTLRDLHTFNSPQNAGSWPFGPSDGGRSAADEMGWDHAGVLSDQRQAERTSLALVLLSAGVPMINGGSELGRTLRGNNNPYNLDTAANWIDWSLLAPESVLVEFVTRLLHFRLAHPVLRPADFFTGRDVTGTGIKDLAWYQHDGREVDGQYFDDPSMHFLAFALDGRPAKDTVDQVFVAYNAWTDAVVCSLPALRPTTCWYQVANTGAEGSPFGYFRRDDELFPPSDGTSVVAGRSVVLFVAR